MTKEEQGQFMRRKAAEKAAEMRRLEVRLQLSSCAAVVRVTPCCLLAACAV
jgi:hypothetical protein